MLRVLMTLDGDRGSQPTYQRIFEVVKRIPRGKVATYGQIAQLAGLAGHARQVGYALSALENDSVPWHRVINVKGEISPRTWSDHDDLQRELLEKEGVAFNEGGKVSLVRFGWQS